MCLEQESADSSIIHPQIPEIIVKCEDLSTTSKDFDLFNSLLNEAVLTNDIDVCKKALNLIDTLEQLMLCSILNHRKLLEETRLSQASICTQKELDRLTDRTHNLEVSKKSIVNRMMEIEASEAPLNDSPFDGTSNNRKGRNAIKVYFPNDFSTVIVIKRGVTLFQALEKKLDLYKHSDEDQIPRYGPDKLVPICLHSRRLLHWEMLLTEIKATEIVLEKRHDSRHLFRRVAVFLPPLLCSVCHRSIFVGKKCCSCPFAVHNKCGQILDEGSRMRTLARCIHHLSLIPITSGHSMDDLRLRAQSHDIRSPPDDNFILRLIRKRDDKTDQNLPGLLKSEPSESLSLSMGSICDTRRGPERRNFLLPDWTPRSCLNRCQRSGSVIPTGSDDNRVAETHSAIKTTPSIAHHVQSANWEIMPEEIIRKERKIGSGSFGTVYEAELLNHGRVAIKELNFSNPGRAQLEKFKNELIALKKCRHKNILSFLGYTSKPSMAIITEWCGGSSLYQYIHVQEQSLNTLIVTQLSKQICQGMCYLHSREIIHRDLKSHNIFLHQENNRDLFVKIGDMGLAAVKSVCVNDRGLWQPTGSIQWMAPEIVRMEVSDPYTVQSDAYAFGVVLYELVAVKLPYCKLDLTRDQILFMVGTGRLKPNIEDARPGTPAVMRAYIEKCCK